MLNPFARGSRSFLGLLLAALAIAIGVTAIAEAQTCSGGSNLCAYKTGNPCTGASTCTPISYLNSYNTPTCTTAWIRFTPNYYITNGSLVTDWATCRTGTSGACSTSYKRCQDLNLYVTAACTTGGYCGPATNLACGATLGLNNCP